MKLKTRKTTNNQRMYLRSKRKGFSDINEHKVRKVYAAGDLYHYFDIIFY